MTTELKPCPFCGGKAEVERYGDHRVSTIYTCTMCSCSLETGEEWGHGTDWNTRAVPDVPELVRYDNSRYDNGLPTPRLEPLINGEYVRYYQAAAKIADERQAAIDARNLLQYEKDQQWQERAEAAEAKLALLKERSDKINDQKPVAWRFHHEQIKDDAWRYSDQNPNKKPWLNFQPLYAAPVASDADLKAENERLRDALEKIACRPHTTGLLWWQIEARTALSPKVKDN